VDEFVSAFGVLVGVASWPGAEVGGGGGSMTDVGGGDFAIDSGKGGMGSSEEEVSMVICFVTGGVWRSV
jgi:hypothetical protein